MIDKRPAAIARCRDVADIIACVRFGREHGARLAIRGGGHNVAAVIAGVGPGPANAGLIAQWTRDYWEELHPASAGGACVNFLMDEGRDRVKAPSRGNCYPLAQIKRRYDPGNVFHVNQNIEPAGEPNP
jgi:FAD/FMN-containing dehydrogenase